MINAFVGSSFHHQSTFYLDKDNLLKYILYKKFCSNTTVYHGTTPSANA